MDGNFDINNINTLLTNATNTIMCDSNCQKQKQIDSLRQTYLNAQNNVNTAQDQLQNAEKQFVTLSQGYGAYNNLQESTLFQNANNIITEFKNKFTKDVNSTITQIDTYSNLLLNFNNVTDLYYKYQEENKQLYKQVDDDSNNILTNDRKTYYEDQWINNLNFYYYILLIIYFVCYVGLFYII